MILDDDDDDDEEEEDDEVEDNDKDDDNNIYYWFISRPLVMYESKGNVSKSSGMYFRISSYLR